MARTEKEKNEVERGEIQLVKFRLGEEFFAVKVDEVREIIKIKKITHVPMMPDFVEGVMNLRGQITTIIDLRLRLGMDAAAARTNQSRVIVAEIGDTQVGIIVDSVQDVVRVPKQSFSAPPKSVSSSVDARFLSAICNLSESLIMLLNLQNVLGYGALDQTTELNIENN